MPLHAMSRRLVLTNPQPGRPEADQSVPWLTKGMGMSEFSLDLNEDQLQLQKWVHDFAEDVIRPAAHEWDEREETPWPIIEEAAKVGIYSFDFIANAFGDATGLTMCLVN